MKKHLVLMVAMLTMVFLVIYGHKILMDRSDPEQTIAEFQDAFNHYDFEGMVNCLESEKAGLLHELLSLKGKRFNLDLHTLMKLAQLTVHVLPQLSDNVLSADDLPRLELTIQNVRQEDDCSVAQVKGALISGESQWSFDALISLVLEDGQWKISGAERAERAETLGTFIGLISHRNSA